MRALSDTDRVARLAAGRTGSTITHAPRRLTAASYRALQRSDTPARGREAGCLGESSPMHSLDSSQDPEQWLGIRPRCSIYVASDRARSIDTLGGIRFEARQATGHLCQFEPHCAGRGSMLGAPLHRRTRDRRTKDCAHHRFAGSSCASLRIPKRSRSSRPGSCTVSVVMGLPPSIDGGARCPRPTLRAGLAGGPWAWASKLRVGLSVGRAKIGQRGDGGGGLARHSVRRIGNPGQREAGSAHARNTGTPAFVLSRGGGVKKIFGWVLPGEIPDRSGHPPTGVQ
jgi:hypothetical protein